MVNLMSKKDGIRIIVLLFIIIFLVSVTPFTNSRYVSETESEVKIEAAYYLLDTNYIVADIKIPDLVPSNTRYTYGFSIANNKDFERTEVSLEYDLSIRTTTNLPLEYELYLNEDYTNPMADNIIINDNFVLDDDETYFREIETDKRYFSYSYDEIDVYTLVIDFPISYKDFKYQDVIESIEIIINSKQRVN